MKNFNVYDPMKRGQGLVLDGQTLAHIEVGSGPIFYEFLVSHYIGYRFCSIARALRRAHS